MKNFAIALLLISQTIVSCSSPEETESNQSPQKASPADIRLHQNNELFITTEKSRGDLYMAEMKEIVYCSFESKAKEDKAKHLLNTMDKIDKEIMRHIDLVSEQRKEVLRKINCSECVKNTGSYSHSTSVDISKIPNINVTVQSLHNFEEDLFDLASEISSLVANSHVSVDQDGNINPLDKYAFKLSEINSGELKPQIRNQIQDSNIHPDDSEVISYMLTGLLQKESLGKDMRAMDVVHYLSIIERRILTSRAIALSAIRLRIAGCR
ncbi:MAG: hypothetical protein DCO96_03715 [Fluviicola sp. XM-24bin1]|nr:MAG: hypothetical protein DCO96_03715 [Fluviicola sp. XM-24bin1]